jgi:hypothetical protein
MLLPEIGTSLQAAKSSANATIAIDLPELGGAEKLKAKNVKVHTLVSFDGH